MADQPQRYPLHRPGSEVQASPSFPALEQEVLEYWKQDGTFQASIDNRPAAWASIGSATPDRLHPAEVFRVLRPYI